MNGYFQLLNTKEGTAIKLIPPTEGGAAIEVSELVGYLQMQGITDVNMQALYNALRSPDTEQTVVIAKPLERTISESMQLRISDDRMEAVVRFYPPVVGGQRLSITDMNHYLQARNIKVPVDEKVANAFIQNPVYCTDILLTHGVAPVQGKDAYIEYTFQTELNTRPARNPDGSVDFHHLNTICHCKKGDLLARLIKEVKGKPGFNLYGERLMPKEVKTARLKFGRNIELSEDGEAIISLIDGHVSLVEDKVFVSDVYEVENVGTSTGNVESEGSVVVNGNVQAGYTIKAKGNVIVKGVVEGAEIQAGGDIVLARGMNGMGKGVLKAGGSIISRYFENSTIYSGTFVEADSILHSNVVAQTEIKVDGRKGFIVGGSVRATDMITCKTLGSEMGTDTYVEVGIDPEQKSRYMALRKEIMEIEKNLKQIQPFLVGLNQKMKANGKLSPEQLLYLKKLMENNKALTDRLFECEEEYDKLDELMQGNANACVKVKEEACAGTKITIKDASVILKDSLRFCRFIYDGGEVRSISY